MEKKSILDGKTPILEMEIADNFKIEGKSTEEFYKNEGVAIFVKGKMVIGIHPDKIENNIKAFLSNGEKEIDLTSFITRDEAEKVLKKLTELVE